MKRIYLLFFLAIVGCTSVKRYKGIESVTTLTGAANQLVDIDLFGTKVETAKEEDKSKTVWELQAEGQQELIKELAKRNTDDEKFTSSLETKYLKAKEKQVTDYTSKDIKLIFSISKKRDYTTVSAENSTFSLADRIEYIQFDVNIPPVTNLNFIKWNKFSTEYASVDVADMTFNESLSITAGSGISSGVSTEKVTDGKTVTNSAGATPNVSATGTISKNEVQKVRFRYAALNGKLSDKQISIEQEGMREIDLAGNVAAEINLKFDETPETLTSLEGYKTAGAYNLPDKLKISLYTVMIPVVAGLPATIDATLNYKYVYRHVKNGEKTYYEWDDNIQYFNGSGTKTITLFKKKDYLPSFYTISKKGEDALAPNQRTRIILEDVISSDTTELIFSSLASAQEFYNWLIKFTPAPADVANPIKIGSYTLKLRTPLGDTNLSKHSFNAILPTMQPLAYYR